MKNIAVIGAGTMGNGIAHTFAQFGYKVNLIDISEESLDKGMETISGNLDRMVSKEKISAADKEATLNNITTYTDISKGVKDIDLVVEAATENEDLKLKIFKQLDENCSAETILASNTSSISITKIASVVSNPERVIGMHFFNPVPVMKLVEVIKGRETSQETTNATLSLSESMGKVPVPAHDFAGFVSNRVLMPMINEAFHAWSDGVAKPEDIDSIMKLGCAFPMGPLRLADYIGLDVCKDIMMVMYNGLDENPKYLPKFHFFSTKSRPDDPKLLRKRLQSFSNSFQICSRPQISVCYSSQPKYPQIFICFDCPD